MPPPTQRWMRPSATANVRIVSARSRSPFGRIVPSAPIDAPRPTGSSAAMWSIAAIFGAPVIEPPGNVASSRSVSETSSPERSLDQRDEVLDARQRPLLHQRRPAHGARLADAREVVPLEVDDHHVLGRVLLGLGQAGAALRPRALDRHRPDPAPAPREEELRATPRRSPSRRRRAAAAASGRSGASALGEPGRVAARTAPTGAGRGSPGRRRRRRSRRAPPRSQRRTPSRSTSAPTRRSRTLPPAGIGSPSGRIRSAALGRGHGSGGDGAAVRRSASDRP